MTFSIKQMLSWLYQTIIHDKLNWTLIFHTKTLNKEWLNPLRYEILTPVDKKGTSHFPVNLCRIENHYWIRKSMKNKNFSNILCQDWSTYSSVKQIKAKKKKLRQSANLLSSTSSGEQPYNQKILSMVCLHRILQVEGNLITKKILSMVCLLQVL